MSKSGGLSEQILVWGQKYKKIYVKNIEQKTVKTNLSA